MAYKLTPADRRARAALLQRKRTSALPRRVAAKPQVKEEANGFTKALHTAGDVAANVGIGLGKGVEGIVDLFAGVGGAVAGIFSDDAQDAVQDFIAKDLTGDLYGNAWQEGLDESILNDSKVGQIIEGVAQGVGQLLPAVAVSVATAGAGAPAAVAQMASLGTTIASAAGTGTEQAFQEGADYGEGMAYGAASGAVEGVTEKLTGGLGGLFGDGAKIAGKAAKSVGKEVAEVGVKRAAKEALGEGVEEMISEVANPALKSIYKGKDAFEEYGDAEFWAGVGEAGIVGAGTSVAYGGTVGRALKTTGVYGDANSVANHIAEQKKLRSQKGLSQADKVQIERNIKRDQEILSKRLQKLSEKRRAKVLEKMPPFFKAMFEADGTIKPEHAAALDANIKAAGDETYRTEIRSSTASAERITEALHNGSTEAHEMRAFTGEMSETQRENLDSVREYMGAVSERSGEVIGDFVIAEKSPEGGAYFDPKSRMIVVGADALQNGTASADVARALENAGWQETVVHETYHAVENTRTGQELTKLVTDNEALHDLAITDVLERGYMKEYFAENGKDADLDTVRKGIEQLIAKENAGEVLTEQEREALNTYKSEVGAFANQRLLGNKAFVKKLITTEPSAAEMLIGKLREMREDLKVRKDPAAKAQLDFTRKAEKLFMQALSEAGGVIDATGKIHIANREDDELTRENSEKMHVSDAEGGENAAEAASGEKEKSPKRGVRWSLAGKWPDGRSVYKSDYVKGTQKSVKQAALIDLVQNVWSNKPIELRIGSNEIITAKFNPELAERSDLAKMAYGNKKGTASDKRITLNLSGDFYAIAQDARYVGMRSEKGKANPAHNDVSEWRYFVTDLVYEEDDGSHIACYMQIDVKRNDQGDWFYSFGIEKGTAPQTLLAVVTDNAATVPDNSLHQNKPIVKQNEKNLLENRVSGDDLLNAQDLISDVRDLGGEVDERGYVTLYHRTSANSAAAIRSTGMMVAKEDGLFFSTKENGQNVGYGDTVVTFKIPAEKLVLDDIFDDEAHLRYPLDKPGRVSMKEYLVSDNNTVRRSRNASKTATLSKGQIAALRANYKGDKVFTKKEVAAAVKTIDALQKLPAATRNELVTHLWRGYNERLNEQGFDMFTEIMWHKIHAEILQETGFEMTEDEIRAMDEQIVNALHTIVKSGKPSVRAKLESATSTEGYRKQANFWRGEHDKAVQSHKLLNNLKFELEKLANQKKGLYVNAANYQGDTFNVAINELAKMNWRGGLVSASKIRERFAALAKWYTKENPLYKGDGGTNSLFRQEIADALNSLGNSQNGALTNEDLLAAETVVKYFAHEIEAHNTVFKDGKRVDAMPAAKEYIEKARRAKEISVKCGVWSGLMRSKFARMVADPAMLMRQADGYLSGFFTEQYEALRQGTIDAAVKERELSEEFEKFFEKNKAYAKRYNDGTVTFNGVEMPLQEGISLFMTMHREHAFAGLAGAGFEIDGKKATENISDGFADEVQAQIAEDLRGLPPEDLLTLTKKKNAELERTALAKVVEKKRTALYDQFTAEDKALIKLMERAFEQCRDVKVRVDEIVQGYSNVTGGYYYPIKRTGLAENVDAYTGFEGDRVTNLSMNKETVKNAHKLYIEPAHIVFMRHLKATSLYHGLGVFTDNFNRLFNLNIASNANNPTTVRTALASSNKYVKEMINYFKELKQDVEGINKKRSQERAYNDAVAFIRSMYATYQLGANPKVWVTQLSSYIAAHGLIDADCLVKGLTVSGKGVDEYCRLAWLRNNDSSAVQAQSVGTSQNAVQRAGRNVLQKIRDVAMLPIGKVDRLMIKRLFGACQVQIEKNGGAKVGTKENKVEAGKLFQRVILETQQNSLSTERSAAMRSSDELLKGFTMFSADAMKVGARFVDAYGELSVLKTLRREAKKAGNTAELKRLEGEIKRAKGQCVRATVALVGVALFNAALAYGFKWLYRRDEEENVGTFVADTFGNMLGGIPFVRDLWSFFQDGFEMDHFLISTVNDVLGTTAESFELIGDAASGKTVTKQQALANMRKVLYAAGQLSGVPTRNIYNVTTGAINRVSPETGYKVESQFYKQPYTSDLAKAIEADDDKMVATIAGLMTDEKIGIEDGQTRAVLKELVGKGHSVLPRAVGDTVTLNGETVTLNGAQQKRLRTVYAIGEEAIGDMVRLKRFAEADDAVKAKAIQFIYDVYWDLALEDALGEDLAEKNVLFAEAIDIEKLAIIIATARSIEADKDKDGRAIAGTKKRKVEQLVSSLRLTAAQKYMVMGYLGYTNANGKGQVEGYISTLKLTKAEKKALLKYSGYAA